MLRQKWNALFLRWDGIVLILLAFLFISLIFRHLFFFGFIADYNRLNAFLFGNNIPSFLQFIPFHSPSIIFASLIHPYFLIGLLIVYLPLVLKFKEFRGKTVEYSAADKILLFVPAFLLTWEAVTFEYNYFLGSAFYIDRIILIVLTFLLPGFPLLTPVFIAFSLVYRSQFNYPVGGFELFEKNILFDILIMFTVYHCIKILAKSPLIPFLWLALGIISANYFYCGMAKVLISPHGYEWTFQNNIADLFMNCHLRGWLANVSQDTIHAIWKFFHDYHILFQVITIMIELSALFMLKSRKLAIIILISSFALHIAIFFCSGALFWKWMAMDLVLLALLVNRRMESIFSQKKHFVASVIVILSSVIWLKPLKIGWFDTNVNQFYTYEVEDENGIVYQLEKNEMNPYHQWFQYDRFSWLVDKECLPLTGFGTTARYKVFRAVKNAPPSDLQDLLMEFGGDHFSMEKTDKYIHFIKTYFHNRNARSGKKILLTYLSPPQHLNNSGTGLLYKDQAPVKKFRVFYNLTFTANGNSSPVEKTMLNEIIVD